MAIIKVSAASTPVLASDIQVKYENLYEFLMDFLWEFEVIQALADLEISIFKRFPDKEEMLHRLDELDHSIKYTYEEQAETDHPEFKEAFEALRDAIEDYEDPGCELYSVEEFVSDPVSAASEPSGIEKRKFKFGDITETTKEEKELQEEAINTLNNPFENNEEGEE